MVSCRSSTEDGRHDRPHIHSNDYHFLKRPFSSLLVYRPCHLTPCLLWMLFWLYDSLCFYMSPSRRSPGGVSPSSSIHSNRPTEILWIKYQLPLLMVMTERHSLCCFSKCLISRGGALALRLDKCLDSTAFSTLLVSPCLYGLASCEGGWYFASSSATLSLNVRKILWTCWTRNGLLRMSESRNS